LADRSRLDRDALLVVAERGIRRVRRGQFPTLGWLVRLLDEAVQQARMRVAPDLMLFRKSLLTLEGVVAEVGERSGQIDRTLTVEFLRHFLAESPRRWLRMPDSRDFPTRLSVLDLLHTMLSYPSAVTRFWTGHGFDILEGSVRRWEAGLRSPGAIAGDVSSVHRVSGSGSCQESP
jgi:hypothetical protein